MSCFLMDTVYLPALQNDIFGISEIVASIQDP